jgi:hypothetical protein
MIGALGFGQRIGLEEFALAVVGWQGEPDAPILAVALSDALLTVPREYSNRPHNLDRPSGSRRLVGEYHDWLERSRRDLPRPVRLGLPPHARDDQDHPRHAGVEADLLLPVPQPRLHVCPDGVRRLDK